MKYRFITYAITMLVLFSACSADNDMLSAVVPEFPSDNEWTEELMDGASVTVSGFKPGDAVTRTSLVYDGQNLVFGWKAGDRVGLYPTAKDMSYLENKSKGLTRAESYGGDEDPTNGQDNNQDNLNPDGSLNNTPGTTNPDGTTEEDQTNPNPNEKDPNCPDNPRPEMQGLLPQETNPHPSVAQEPNLYRVDPQSSNQSRFWCEASSSQTTRIVNGSADFIWDDIVRWSAYFPWSEPGKQEETYEKRYFSFTGQKQRGLTELGEYFDWEDNKPNKEDHLNRYKWSEAQACEHLGDYDVMISPEMKWEGTRINFKMKHVGAIARLYLMKIEENLVVKDVKLICDSPIFYEGGSLTLISHPYNSEATDGNDGVDLSRSSDNCQIQPEGSPVKMLQLDFDTEACITKKTGTGNWGPYVVAYLMMYPITYDPAEHGNLFAYVTTYSKTDPSAEKHFVSPPLEGKVMESGNYYQWNARMTPQDGLYPIELTATLLPWQEIVGSSIGTDLTK